MAGSRLRQPNAALSELLGAVLGYNTGKTDSDECVILLHGLLRSRLAMGRLAVELQNDYQIINNSYPSRRYTIEELARRAIEPALEHCDKKTKVHFVTHSLGGILVRQYLSEHEVKNLGNVVMLGPPNQGSEIVDFFQSSPFMSSLFELANGPAGTQLGTNDDGRPKALGPVDFHLGVIAGNKSFNPVLSSFLPGEGDGKVTVESSKVDGMVDHLVLPVDHTFMMRDSKVIHQVKTFLKQGHFDRNDQ